MRTFLNLSSGAVALLLGLPALGQVQPDWRLTYTTPAHPAGSHDRLTAFELAPNGDILWASHHNGFGTSPHAPLALRAELHRTSATGAPVWTVSPPPNYDVSYFNVALDSVGDCYFSGHAGQLYSNSDLLVTKVSASGSVAWTRQVNGPMDDDDVGFGSLDASDHFSFFGLLDWNSTVLVRTYDTNGNVLVDSTLPAATAGIERLWEARRTPGGDFVAAASWPGELVVVCFDSAGALRWRSALPIGPTHSGRLHSLSVAPNGRIAAAGFEDDGAGSFRHRLRVLDGAGNVLLDLSGPWQGLATNACKFAPDGALWYLTEKAVTPSELTVRRFRPDLSIASNFTLQLPPLPVSQFAFEPGESGQLWLMIDGQNLMEISPAGTLNWSVALAAPGSFDFFGAPRITADRFVVAGGYHDASSGAYADLDVLLARFDARETARGYCVGMPGALGCAPQLEFHGAAQAGASSGFVVTATPWRNQTQGSFLVGVGPALAAPFFGGTLCVGVPRVRTPPLASGGNPIGTPDCSGALSLDFGAWASGSSVGAVLPGIQSVGTRVRMQAWSRDPGSATNTLLSNALEFTLLP